MLTRYVVIDTDYVASTWWADDIEHAMEQYKNSKRYELGDFASAWTIIDTGERKAA